MYVLILAMLAAGPSLDAIDDANLALTSCGFAAFREADAQNLLLSQFKRTLASRCADEMRRTRALAVEFNMSRKGMSREVAERTADGLIGDFEAGFISQYHHREQTRAQLNALERAVQQQGD